MNALPIITEHHIQAAAFDLIRLRAINDWRYQLIYAIPNGGKRHIGVARKMKAEGQKSGVWDMSVDVPCGDYHGLKIEVKRPGGKLTPDQLLMGRLYQKAGYFCKVCYSTLEIMSAIENYLSLIASTSQPEKITEQSE